MRWILVAAVVGSLVLGVSAAFATHGTAPTVDAIDGSGAGTFNGNINNTTSDSADWYTFYGIAGTPVTITMASGAFDTVLTLYQAPGVPAAGDARASYTQIAFNDDFPVCCNSQIDAVLPASGYYVVAAESISAPGDTLGDYTLTITGDVFASQEAGLEACKQGGWENMTDVSGTSFKNQGDCVSYFDTGGANPANG